MHISLPRHRAALPVLLAFAALLLILLVPASRAGAATDLDPGSAEFALAAQLEATEGGVVVGDEIHYADGTVFVAVDAGVLSLGQCASGRFCLWSSPSYQGSFTYKTGTGVTRTISGAVGSFWNRRSQVAKLYSNAGTSHVCYENGVQKSSVSSSYNSAAKVYLAVGSSC